MAIVLFFLLYTTALAVWSGLRHWRRAHDPGFPPAPGRLTNRQLTEFGARQLLFTAVLWIGFRSGGWTAESVGIPDPGVRAFELTMKSAL